MSELEKKIEQLESENAALTAKLEEANAMIATLETANPSKKELAELKKRVSELEEDNLELAHKVSVAEKHTEKAGLKIVSNSEGERFKLACEKFKFQGKDISFEDLKNSPEMVDQLIAKSSGLLTPLN